MTHTFTMHIECPAGTVRMHGFHLGTDHAVAERIVLEKLSADPSVVSIALRLNDGKGGGKLVHIYDFRDLPGNKEYYMNNIEKECLQEIADAIAKYLLLHLDSYAAEAMNYLDQLCYPRFAAKTPAVGEITFSMRDQD